MSSEAVPITGALFDEREQQHVLIRHSLRIAGGIVLPFVIGEALGWNLPFMASIFALLLLAENRPAPTIAAAIGSVLGIAIAFFAALVLTRVTLAQPLLFATVIGTAVFSGLYGQMRSGSP